MNKRIIKKIFYYPKGSLYYLLMNLRGILNKQQYTKHNIHLNKEYVNNIQQNFYFFTDDQHIMNQWTNNNHIETTANKIIKQPNILWRQDDISGHIWPLSFYLNIRNNLYKDYNKNISIKNVWNKSRFYEAPILALAYYNTGNAIYLTYFENLFLDWNKNNPWGYGPNWAITLEVALRSCNLTLSFKILEQAHTKYNSVFDPKFQNIFMNSILQHGKFIEQNLELFPVKTNHFLSNVLGLLYIGCAFPQLKKSKQYVNFGFKHLSQAIQTQIDNDGVDKEGSIGYHRFKLELFAYGSLLYKLNQTSNKILNLPPWDANYWTKLHKMFEYVFLYTKPNQLAPQIGDNDESRLHILEDKTKYNSQNHTSLLNLYKFIFPNTTNLFDSQTQSCLFKHAGIGIIKNNHIYLITGRNNPNNNAFSAHFHNDIGSFELNINKKDFIVDPGTYCYTENLDIRNKWRSTSAHNTILTNNIEQNNFDKDQPFFMNFQSKKSAKTKILNWQDNQQQCIYEIQWRVPNTLITRKFTLQKQENMLEILDRIVGNTKQNIQWFFHCNTGITISEITDNANEKNLILENDTTKVQMNFSKELNCELKDDFISPKLYEKIPSKTIWINTIQTKKQKEYLFKFKLY